MIKERIAVLAFVVVSWSLCMFYSFKRSFNNKSLAKNILDLKQYNQFCRLLDWDKNQLLGGFHNKMQRNGNKAASPKFSR